MRIFVSVPVPGPVADRLGSLVDGLGFGRAVPPGNMHVTLAFFADLNADEVEALAEELARLQLWAFDLTLGGLDLMGRRTPGLLVAPVADCPPLADLHRQVQGALRAAGLVPERRKFRPHVTLLRFGGALPPAAQARLQALIRDGAGLRETFCADRITLNRSYLGTRPPLYEPLAEMDLKAPPFAEED